MSSKIRVKQINELDLGDFVANLINTSHSTTVTGSYIIIPDLNGNHHKVRVVVDNEGFASLQIVD